MPYVGQAIPGLLSQRLVAGHGTYVGDIVRPRMAYAAVLRSPYAHARIRSIDTEEAAALPGVLAVVTGAEIVAHTDPIPWSLDVAGMGAKTAGVKWYALAPDHVRYVGEAVAAVVAEDKYTAYQALDRIVVDYEELPSVLEVEEAMRADAPLVEDDWGDNILLARNVCVGEVDAAFASAEHVARGVVKSNRITGTPLEPRGCVADYDSATEMLTFWDSTQDPHPLRLYLARTLRMSENSIHVIQPNVGGAFGLKQPTFQEEPLVAYLSRKIGRPVKWIEQRSENFQAGGHSRDTKFYYEVAATRDGVITALRVKAIADVGAPTALLGWGMAFVTWLCLPGMYKIPNMQMELYAVVTNKCPWNAYRGYGKDAATFVMERVMDAVAKETGQDRAAVRFQHFIQPDEFPYPQASGAMLDSGDYPAALRQVLTTVDYEHWPERQAAALREGRRIGLGISMELTPEGACEPSSPMINGYDGTTVRVAPSGAVTVLTGVTSPGSGNETAMAQIVADALGCRIERIKVIQGDTDSCPYGLGNYSSRSTMYGGSASYMAAMDVRKKMFQVAGKMLEVSEQDLEASEDRIYVAGAPGRSVGFDDVVRQVYFFTFGPYAEDVEPALEATRHFRIGNIYHQPDKQGRFSPYPVWPYAAVACEVEVDPETGFLKILRYCYVHDAGRIINPLLAEGNLHGGLTQGLGSALYEEIRYTDTGQPATVTFMDYTIPTAVEVPNYEIAHRETPSPFTKLGVKGVGESGLGGILNALCSAVEDAFPEKSLTISDLPLKPNTIWRALHDVRTREAVPKA